MAGLFAANGTINVTVVSGNSYVGAYAADGSMNVQLAPNSGYCGRTAPSGATYVKEWTTAAPCPLYAPNGALYVTTTASNTTGACRITVVAGSLSTFTTLVFTSSIPASVTVNSSPAGYAPDSSGNLTLFSANAGRRTDLGLLVEPSRTNLCLRSADMVEPGAWLEDKTNRFADVATDPAGGTTAERWTEKIENGIHSTYNAATVAVTNGAVYTFTVYAKSILSGASRRDLRFYVDNGGTANISYNFTLTGAGTVSAQSFAGSPTMAAGTATIEAVANGYYRCSITQTMNATSARCYLYFLKPDGSSSYLGEAGCGLEMWGIQYELGSTKTSWISTTTATVTRAADNISFTIPSGITTLRYTFDDDTTQDVSVTAGTYTIPTTLNRYQIKSIAGL